MTSVLLIGAPGTGKTSVVTELQRNGWTAGDTGQALESEFGEEQYLVTVDVPASERTKRERDVLAAMLDDVANNPEANYAISAGSEVFGDDPSESPELIDTVESMRKNGSLRVVQLTSDLSSLMKRNGLMGQRSSSVVMPRKNLRELLDRRRPLYDSLSDSIIDSTDREPAHIAADIIRDFGA